MSRWIPLDSIDDSGRRLGRVFAVLAVVAVVGFGVTTLSAPGTLAASFTASDVATTTSDGEISAVTLNPDFDASWSGLDAGVHNLGYQIEVSDDGSNWESLVIATMDCTNPNSDFSCGVTSGTETIYQGNANYDLLDGNDYHSGTSPFAASDFAASDGSTSTTTVHLRVTISVDDTNGDLIDETTVTQTFDVIVTNSAGSISLSGSMGTGVTA